MPHVRGVFNSKMYEQSRSGRQATWFTRPFHSGTRPGAAFVRRRNRAVEATSLVLRASIWDYLKRSGIAIAPTLEVDTYTMAMSLITSTGGLATDRQSRVT